MSVAELRNKRNNLKTKTDAIFDNHIPRYAICEKRISKNAGSVE